MDKTASLEAARQIINDVDAKMADLFIERMRTVRTIAEYKREHGLAVLDPARENEVIKRSSERIDDPALSPYYKRFIKQNMALSRAYQSELLTEKSEAGALRVSVEGGDYDITVGRGLLSRAGELFNLNRRVLVVTDSGVPEEYARTVAALAKAPTVITVKEGEGSKSLEVLSELCSAMLDGEFDRGDCVVAVGGGVVGDLAGLAASLYMRGIDFYNIPTTLLSQVDSSIGGKTAVNHGGVKNIVGAFYQPKGVIIDPDLLSTLPKRQIASGLAEAVKMAITSDAALFELIEGGSIEESLEEIIIGALKIKKSVVEADEREAGLRKILNFGHTLGHGIEAVCEMRGLFHGECVALGMIPMCSEKIRERVLPVLNKIGIDVDFAYDLERALSFVSHDKKRSGDKIEVVFSDEIGSFRLERLSLSDYSAYIRKTLR